MHTHAGRGGPLLPRWPRSKAAGTEKSLGVQARMRCAMRLLSDVWRSCAGQMGHSISSDSGGASEAAAVTNREEGGNGAWGCGAARLLWRVCVLAGWCGAQPLTTAPPNLWWTKQRARGNRKSLGRGAHSTSSTATRCRVSLRSGRGRAAAAA